MLADTETLLNLESEDETNFSKRVVRFIEV